MVPGRWMFQKSSLPAGDWCVAHGTTRYLRLDAVLGRDDGWSTQLLGCVCACTCSTHLKESDPSLIFQGPWSGRLPPENLMICCGRKHGLGLCIKDLEAFKFTPNPCEKTALGCHGLESQGRCLIGSGFSFCGLQAREYRVPIPWHALSLHQQWQALSTFPFLAPLCAPWVHNYVSLFGE